MEDLRLKVFQTQLHKLHNRLMLPITPTFTSIMERAKILPNIFSGKNDSQAVSDLIDNTEDCLDALVDLTLEIRKYQNPKTYYIAKLENINWNTWVKRGYDKYDTQMLDIFDEFRYEDFLSGCGYVIYQASKSAKGDYVILYILKDVNSGMDMIKRKMDWKEDYMGYYLLNVSEEYAEFLKLKGL